MQNVFKTFLQWLAEDAPANNIGSENIASKPLPLAMLRRNPRKNGDKKTKRTRVERTVRI